jgi:hypothetical protein
LEKVNLEKRPTTGWMTVKMGNATYDVEARYATGANSGQIDSGVLGKDKINYPNPSSGAITAH